MSIEVVAVLGSAIGGLISFFLGYSVGRRATHAQAIAATLGATDAKPTQAESSGTCQIETTENWLPAERYHRCKECGAFFAVLNASHDIPPRFCPNCGRRIVEPTTNDVDVEVEQ